MKILQVSSAQYGGAGIAAYRLHKGLRSLGADSWMLVNKRMQRDDYVVSPTNNFDKFMVRLCALMDALPGHFSGSPEDKILSSAWMPNRSVSRIRSLSPDVINLHWINDGFMRIESLPKLEHPIVWTLHDMWAFCGGGHYVGENARYREGYSASNCPSSQKGFDIDRWIWQRKHASWPNIRNLVIATPSKWLAGCVRDSLLFRHRRVEVLPNGVDHERFRPMDHSTVRKILGLPEEKKLILFGAGLATSDRRKGFHLLLESLNTLEDQVDPDEYELMVFGALSADNSVSMKTHYLGKLQDEISMALVYAAADVFVAPSMEENLANTVLESLSCGTPVVAFDIGGMPDMISHKKNGYLARPFDTSQMAEGIKCVVNDRDQWRELSHAARKTVVDSFTLKHCATRYLDLYREILRR